MEFYHPNKENSNIRVYLSVLLSLGILLCSFLIMTRDNMSYSKISMYLILCFIFIALLLYINSVLTSFFNLVWNFLLSLTRSLGKNRNKNEDSNEEYLE